jgi:predicted Zn-dependent peptidase
VFEEIRFVRSTSLQPERMGLVREGLLREFERNSQDNGFVLNQLARRYEDGDAAGIAAGENSVEQISALTADAIQQAAQRYLDTSHYVKVTLMPETN